MTATEDDYATAAEWTDEGLRIHRLDWMTDEQWREMNVKMQAWWDEYLPAFLAGRDGEVAR